MLYILEWIILITVWPSENKNTGMSWALKETFYLVKNRSNKLFQDNFWFVSVHTQYIHNIAAMQPGNSIWEKGFTYQVTI